MTILGVDVGTTSLKMGIFDVCDDRLERRDVFSQSYPMNVYHDGLFADIDQDHWRRAFAAGCRRLAPYMAHIDVIALSGTTPGLTFMDQDGNALYPAILMLDQRSREQAGRIIETVGMETLLETTGNMPVAGGCSLAGILWLQENRPEVLKKTAMIGHSNTYMARWLTGAFAIDPSSASLTALYNTAAFDLTWNGSIARSFGIDTSLLPPIIRAYEPAGRVLTPMAAELGLKKAPPVLIGGNDAVLAAYSVGVEHPGEVINVNGTSEITLVCLPECLASRRYNIRAHVVPDRWLTLYVMNAGGKALAWFRTLFCSELTPEQFYGDFLPAAIDTWLQRDSTVTYTPFLMGSRYSLKPCKAEFLGLTQETTREEILASMVRGLCRYQRAHLEEVGRRVPLRQPVHLTGGALNDAMIRAKKTLDVRQQLCLRRSVIHAGSGPARPPLSGHLTRCWYP